VKGFARGGQFCPVIEPGLDRGGLSPHGDGDSMEPLVDTLLSLIRAPLQGFRLAVGRVCLSIKTPLQAQSMRAVALCAGVAPCLERRDTSVNVCGGALAKLYARSVPDPRNRQAPNRYEFHFRGLGATRSHMRQ
jgi:hypothetical protein